jgi:hypothetical protein
VTRGQIEKFAPIAAMVVLLTACTAAPSEPAPTVTVTATTTVTATPQAEVAPASTTHPVGETVDRSEGWRTTLHGVNLDPAPDGPQPQSPGNKWVSLDVENCAGPSETEAYINSSPWRIVAADNRQYQASGTGYGTFPTPDYAFGDTPISAGECIRGWITFDVARDATLVSVKYQTTTGEETVWNLQ